MKVREIASISFTRPGIEFGANRTKSTEGDYKINKVSSVLFKGLRTVSPEFYSGADMDIERHHETAELDHETTEPDHETIEPDHETIEFLTRSNF